MNAEIRKGADRAALLAAARRLVLAVLAGFGLLISIAGQAAAIHENQHTEPFNDAVQK